MTKTQVNKDINIKAIPEKNIGIETKDDLVDKIAESEITTSQSLDMTKLESFTTLAQNRESIYKIIDTMAQDSTIASVLETYVEDAIERNDEGDIIWCESSDPNAGKYVTYLLNSMDVNKHAYNWMYNLIKYGDLYLRLYRESDYEKDNIFDGEKNNTLNESKEAQLKENVNLNISLQGDHYVHYLEKMMNPGEMFELTRFGKTAGYIQAPTNILSNTNTGYIQSQFQYKWKKGDVDIYQATDFVHAVLEDSSSRIPEEVEIFKDTKSLNKNKDGITYTVRRGQSILYNVFKIWRELSLLENSVLLNRVTKSSIIRMISVEVGDMPKENVANYLSNIKSLIEQKSAIDTGASMAEYTNPGPIENSIYIPTHQGIGAISTQQVGGDVDPKQLTDLDYFQNKFFAALRVPKQFFGVTDDAAGFNGGSSLSIISSRYGKAVKRIQNSLIQALTDAVNLMLLDKGLDSYINNFTIKMTTPVTQEEIDKRENLSNKVRVVGDIMNMLSDVDDPSSKLKILKSLISNVITDSEVIKVLQDKIDGLEAEAKKAKEDKAKKTAHASPANINVNIDDDGNFNTNIEPELESEEAEQPESELPPGIPQAEEPIQDNLKSGTIGEVLTEESEDEYLPSGAELDINLLAPGKKY